MSGKTRTAEIVGAGLAGLAAAAALAQRGWKVRVHERADDIRGSGSGIYIWENGLRVLEALGAYEDAIRGAHAAYFRETRDGHNQTLFSVPYSNKRGERLYTIVRQQLLESLRDAALRSGATIAFSSSIQAAKANGTIVFDSGERIEADLVIGADGVNSKVRDSLSLLESRKQLSDGCIRLMIERSKNERETYEGGMYVEHWSGARRILYTPCSERDLYLAFTCLNTDTRAKHLPLDKQTWIESFPHLASLLERVGEQGRWDPFEVVRLRKWSRGRVAIVGDAATAMAPNLGQGGGCAIMNALSMAVFLENREVEDGLALWERSERPLSNHTQRVSSVLSHITAWPERLRAGALKLSGRSRFLMERRFRTANHVPLGT
jgi:2-polyprenyl-6-methoxyphenol hydroxylase-like FAD-dependent oxidoreductase